MAHSFLACALSRCRHRSRESPQAKPVDFAAGFGYLPLG